LPHQKLKFNRVTSNYETSLGILHVIYNNWFYIIQEVRIWLSDYKYNYSRALIIWIWTLDYPNSSSDCSIRVFCQQVYVVLSSSTHKEQIHLSEYFLWFSLHKGVWMIGGPTVLASSYNFSPYPQVATDQQYWSSWTATMVDQWVTRVRRCWREGAHYWSYSTWRMYWCVQVELLPYH